MTTFGNTFFTVKSKNDLSEEEWKSKQFTTKATYKYENLEMDSTENVSRYYVQMKNIAVAFLRHFY